MYTHKKTLDNELMDAAIDQLGLPIEKKSERKEAAEKIATIISEHQFNLQNEPSEIVRRDRENLEKVQSGVQMILGALRVSDIGFSGFFLEPTSDNDLAPVRSEKIKMLELWDRKINSKLEGRIYSKPSSGGRPRGMANRLFTANLHDLFESCNSRKASSTPGGPFESFVQMVCELSTGKKMQVTEWVKEIRQIVNETY